VKTWRDGGSDEDFCGWEVGYNGVVEQTVVLNEEIQTGILNCSEMVVEAVLGMVEDPLD